MVEALFCEAKLYLTRFLISSNDGELDPPTAGIGFDTLSVLLTLELTAELGPLTTKLKLPKLFIAPGPTFEPVPPPTLYLT